MTLLLGMAVVAFIVTTVLPPLVMPLVYRLKLSWLRKPRFENFTPDDLPPAPRQEFTTSERELEAEGFTLLARLAWSVAPPEKTHFAIFVHRETGDVAVNALTLTGNTLFPVGDRYALFWRQFKNDHAIWVHSAGSREFLWRQPGKRAFAFPQAKTIRHLRVLRDKCLTVHARGMEAVGIPAGEETRRVCDMVMAAHERLLDNGLFEADKATGRIRPTWRGAVWLTRGRIWPLKTLDAMARRRRANALLSELLGEGKTKTGASPSPAATAPGAPPPETPSPEA